MNRNQILQLKIDELRQKLVELDLDSGGRKKAELQQRLLDHYNIEEPIADEEEVNESFTLAPEFETVSRPHFTLKDIEESLTTFSGNGHPEVETWLLEYEDNTTAVNWSDPQKLIYGKQLMRGAARSYIRSQADIKNWSDFKKALIKEFSQKLTAADRHAILSNKKKRNNESLLEFLYSIIEISKPIGLDEQSIIQYFTDGIPDSKSNKTLLYQAITIEELKAKIRVYERIKSSSNTYAKSYDTSNRKKCVHCPHLQNHMTQDCKKVNGKCFHCGQKGHRSFECRTKESNNKNKYENVNKNNNKFENKQWNRNNYQATQYRQNENYPNRGNGNNPCQNEEMPSTSQTAPQWYPKTDQRTQAKAVRSAIRIVKTVQIHGKDVDFIVDTGSDVNLLKETVYTNYFGYIKLNKQHIAINGIGGATTITQGYFTTEIKIDDIKLTIDLHVVKDHLLGMESLLGNTIFEHLTMTINADGATFKFYDKKPKNYNDKFEAGIAFNSLCVNEIAMPKDELNININLDGTNTLFLKQMIRNYKPIKTIESPIEMNIILTDETPIFQKYRRIPISEQKVVEAQVEKWLKEGIISESTSPYGSPVVLVAKKDGTKRLCCDYRKLNQKIIKDNYPMMLMDEAIQRLQGANYYTTLDLKNGFFHVRVNRESTKYTAFTTHIGQFEFNFVPFGISNSPAVFCRYIVAIFQNLIRAGKIIIYMDDIIIPSETIKEGIKMLREVLATAEPHGLNINWTKCQFLQKKVQFLGYIIENSTVQPSKEKTKAIRNYPEPKNQKSLQRFLGLTSYFRKFVNGYATIARPLTDLLTKNAKFRFDTEEKVAFNQLKTALTDSPVLMLFNPNAYTEIHTDASMYGYGAVLLQKNSEDEQLHPIEYMSRKTTTTEMNYHSYELEVLAVIEALKKWRCYLLGKKFKIVTDCNAFTGTVNKKDIPLRVTRWIMYLQDFEYQVEHRKGTRMKHVDALSRVYTLLAQDPLKNKIIEAQNNDEWTKTIKKIVVKELHEDYFIKNGILHKDVEKQLIVIPQSLEREIIEIAHRQGHFSAQKTQQIVSKDYYIPNIQAKAQNFVKSCIACILAEPKSGKKEGYLNPIDKSDRPLDTLHLDHLGPMEATKKQYNYILTIVDAFSKFTWIFPTKSTGADEVVDKLQKLTAIFGNPNRVITDRGTAFTANKFKEFCENNQICHQLITTGVPRSNGQVERIHRTIITALSKLCIENKSHWYKYTDRLQQTLNSTTTRSTKHAPFTILTGLKMKTPESIDMKEIIEQENLAELDNNRNEIRKLAKENIQKIQQENKKTFNSNRKIETNYNIGDLVAIKRTQYGPGLKLKRKYLGPYEIKKKKGHGRYDVEKVGETEGPNKTTTMAEYMKRWNTAFEANPSSG